MAGRTAARGGEELHAIIRGVRRRWRLRLALRGLLVVLLAAFAAYLVSAWGMERLRYGPGAVTAARLLVYGAFVAVAVRFLLIPLRARVRDQHVALYVEEREPTLDAAVVSAVDVSTGRAGPGASPALSRRLVETAVERCHSVEAGRRIDRRSLRQLSGAFAGALAVVGAAVLVGPPFLRHAAPFLLVPWNARAESPYAIEVRPGNATVARGSDQSVTARLRGFDSDRVEVAVLSGSEGEWRRLPMSRDEAGEGYQLMLFDLDAPTRYFVDASGVRSQVYELGVADLAHVKRIDLEYQFPGYTGLSPKKVEDGGDIAALRGTRVTVSVVPTFPVPGGRLVLEGAGTVDLAAAADGSLSAVLEVSRDGFYKVELAGREGLKPASPDYVIEVLADQPPSVTFRKPGRDARVTSIEEVYTELQAEDDYGLGRLELVYSVNGGPEEKKLLYRGGAGRKSLTAGHTFFLEELGMEVGDFVSYYAKASDGRAGGTQTTTTDIYFMEVRPFGREYRQAEQRGMPGGGGGADGALSHQQRQVVAATFKLSRDRGVIPEKEYEEDVATVALAQGRLLEQVETLLKRMAVRGIADSDPEFRRTADSLEAATTEMATARDILGQAKAKEALPPEQKALQHLQRAEAAFRDVQVSFGDGGAGGGGQELAAEDLADLFDLELDKLRNQYETVQRGGRQEADEKVDEALQRLQELARRQQQENERTKALADKSWGGAGGAGRQRELAEQAEELARRLERLSRDQPSPGLQETARRLRQAADAMRRSAAEGRDGAMAEGLAALDRLQEARRLLDKDRAGRLERDLADASRRAAELKSAQDRIASEVGGLGEAGADRRERVSRLLERKDELAQQVQGLERDLDRMARSSRGEQKEASRKLQQAADSIRESKLHEKIRYSKGVVQGRSTEYAREFEGEIGEDIEGLEERIEEAAGAVGPAGGDRRTASLDKARDLVRRMESLGERIRDRSPGRGRDGQPEGRGDQDGSAPARDGQAEGGPAGSGRSGSPPPGTQPGQSGGGQGFAPGPFTPDEVRQLRREVRERLREAEELERELAEGGPWASDLRGIVRRIRAMDSQGPYGDPRGLEALAGAVIEDLKMFEYALRRNAEGGRQKLLLSASDEVPSGWRPLVEEYYRRLSQGRDR